jgi:very-short-patch-repair endonuclease
LRTSDITLARARSFRKSLTSPELGLWLRLKNRKHGGFKFRRQHPIGPYVLDFYCAEARPAVEIDGEVHNSPDQVAHDRRRDAYFREHGIETLRLGASLLKNPGLAAERIIDVFRGGGGRPSPPLRGPPLPRAGEVAGVSGP